MSASAHVSPWLMEAMKRRLHGLVEILGPERRVLYAGLPTGDEIPAHMVAEGAETLFAAHAVQVVGRVAFEDLDPERLRRLHGNVTIVLHGSDRLGDLSLPRERHRAALLSAVRDHRVVVLPSALPGDGERAALDPTPYRRHPRLTLCVRDHQSLGQAGALAADVRLMPDTSHALWGLLDHYPTGHGTLALPDTEGPSEITGAQWAAALPAGRVGLLRRHRAWMIRTRFLRRRMAFTDPAYRALAIARRRAIEGARRAAVTHDTIESDSLHASILASLVGRGWRTGDARVAGYWRSWDGLRTTDPS